MATLLGWTHSRGARRIAHMNEGELVKRGVIPAPNTPERAGQSPSVVGGKPDSAAPTPMTWRLAERLAAVD